MPQEDTVKLLVAADESNRFIESVVPVIDRLAGDATPEVTVLHIIHAASEAWSDEELAQLVAERKHTLEQQLEVCDFDAQLLIESLPYGDELANYIAARARDLEVGAVVVCSKHSTGVLSGILGSVAQGLLRESTVPVLVIRPEKD